MIFLRGIVERRSDGSFSHFFLHQRDHQRKEKDYQYLDTSVDKGKLSVSDGEKGISIHRESQRVAMRQCVNVRERENK